MMLGLHSQMKIVRFELFTLVHKSLKECETNDTIMGDITLLKNNASISQTDEVSK